MPIDINKLIGSLDEETLAALSAAIENAKGETAEAKEEEVETIKPVEVTDDLSSEEVQQILKENGSICKSRKAVEHIYYETIKADEWEKNGSNEWKHTREIYTDEYQIRESCLLSIELDENKMLEGLEKGSEEYQKVTEFIDDIYANERIRLNSDNIVGTFYYTSSKRPEYPISLIIHELPFPDCPASSMGL